MYLLCHSLLLASIVSCASKSQVKISSVPLGAKIYAKSMTSDQRESLGVTPLVMKAQDLEKRKLKKGPIFIELEKDGFHNQSVLLTETESVDIDVSLKLQRNNNDKFAKDMDKISSKLFEVQRLIRKKSFSEALGIITKLKEKNPNISVADELEGSIYYLQKDYKKSLDAFNKAFTKNTKNNFAFKMKKIIENRLKVGK